MRGLAPAYRSQCHAGRSSRSNSADTATTHTRLHETRRNVHHVSGAVAVITGAVEAETSSRPTVGAAGNKMWWLLCRLYISIATGLACWHPLALFSCSRAGRLWPPTPPARPATNSPATRPG